MTEPQELRSIDELFKSTFNNLPETPASSGWDTPSERVWDHVRDNIQAPRSGWSLQSLMILAGFAILVAVGLYFAFSGAEKAGTDPVETATPAITAPVAPVVEAPVVAPASLPEPAVASIPAAPKAQRTYTPRTVKPALGNTAPKRLPVEELPIVTNREMPHSNGAAPLPGSNEVKIPNTTEALKIEHVKQLEILWRTPLDFLPVPNTKKAKN